jgi:hypothetical protein
LAAHYSPSGPLTFTALCALWKIDLCQGPPKPPPGRRRRPRLSGSISTRGYALIGIAGKLHRVHRMVMEAVLGRHLRPGEDVHHVDGNPLHNRPANLRVLSHAEHRRISGRQLPLFGLCQYCGARFLMRYHYYRRRHGPGVVAQRFCSRSCRMFYRWRREKAIR